MSYTELSVEERAGIQIGNAQGFSLSRMARLINRSPSTISRELRRNRAAFGSYSARVAQQRMQARRQVWRPMRKLLPTSNGVAQVDLQQVGSDTYAFYNDGALAGADQVVKLSGVALTGVDAVDFAVA